MQKNSFISSTITIYHSNLKRSTQCIKKIKNKKYISTKFLDEIPFKLDKYCDDSRYKEEGNKAVRKIFKRLFVEDKLMIKRKQIFSQIDKLFLDIKNKYRSEKIITVVSHSFRLKCIEAYLKTNRKILENPKLTGEYIKNNQKTFNFGEGFNFDV